MILQVRQGSILSSPPDFLNIKPQPGLQNSLQKMGNFDRASVLWARQSCYTLECGCKQHTTTVFNALHVLTECKNLDNIIFKLKLFNEIWTMMPHLKKLNTQKLALATLGNTQNNSINIKYIDLRSILKISSAAFRSLKDDLNNKPEFLFRK